MKRRKQLAASTAIERDDSDNAVTITGVAAMFEISPVSVWRMVKAGAIPAPFYPRPRCPRWSRRELREAREQMRMLPSEAKAAHRAEKLRGGQHSTSAP
jgi:hypothetical protein